MNVKTTIKRGDVATSVKAGRVVSSMRTGNVISTLVKGLDTANPLTVVLTSNATNPISSTDFTLVITFSRSVVALTAANFTLSNCTFGNITTDDNIIWVVTVTATFGGNISILLPAGVVTGTAGGVNSISNAISLTVPTDYLTSIVDEWYPHRNARINPAGDSITTWYGRINAKPANGVSTIFPSLGKYNVSGTQYFNFNQVSPALGWAGNITFAMRLRSAGTLTNSQEIFWNSTGGDALRLYAKGTTGKIGLRVISTIYNGTTTWPQDGADHCVAYVINFPAGTCKFFVDGSLQETINFTPATGIDYTTLSAIPFGRFSSTIYLSQTFDKVRIYSTALSDANAQILTNSANFFRVYTETDNSNTRVGLFGGQSNEVGSGLTPADYPAYLQATMADVFGWAGTTLGFVPTIPGTQPTVNCGPQLKCLYDLRIKYPNDRIYYLYKAAANQSLAVNWLSSGVGNLYTDQVGEFSNAIKVLQAVEMRNVTVIFYQMMQGEEDATNLSWANAYQTNLSNWIDDARGDFVGTGVALDTIIWDRIHDDLPIGARPYSSTVRAAVDWNVANKTNVKSVNTDDNSRFPLQGDFVHFTAVGEENLGADNAALL